MSGRTTGFSSYRGYETKRRAALEAPNADQETETREDESDGDWGERGRQGDKEGRYSTAPHTLSHKTTGILSHPKEQRDE